MALRISATKLWDFGKGLHLRGRPLCNGLGRYSVAVILVTSILPMSSEGETDMLNVIYKPDIK